MTTIKQSQVQNLKPLQRRLVSDDGRTTWHVQWMPDVCDNDAALDNLNMVDVIWNHVDDCPVFPTLQHGRISYLRAARQSFAGTCSCVHEPTLVDGVVPLRHGAPDPDAVAALPRLEPGEYRVLAKLFDGVRVDDDDL